MTGPLTLDQPGQYRILIQGHLSQGWVKWFGELALTIGYDEAGQPITTLSGMIADQAELHGILIRIRDLGLPLLLVELEPAPAEEIDEPTHDSG